MPACLPCPPGTYAVLDPMISFLSLTPLAGPDRAGDVYDLPERDVQRQPGPVIVFRVSPRPIQVLTVYGLHSGLAAVDSNVTGLRDCMDCPAGRTSNGPQQCADCPPGTFSGAGNPLCSNCPVGKAQPSPAQSQCDLCPLGSEEPSERQTQCSPCADGRYVTWG
jgi:hypothetical protein